MPISDDFAARLLPLLDDLVATYDTPFHIYDARGILTTHRELVASFADAAHKQYFAVKALPNPSVLALLLAEGSGLDCASATELTLAARVGATDDDVVFTSNNTHVPEYQQALDAGAVVTFDDRSFLDRIDELPETVSFRMSPHGSAAESGLMGDPTHSKFGVPVAELAEAYREAALRGATRFGLHGMTCANELSLERAVRAASDVFATGAQLVQAGIELEYVNIGGGLGVPYRPEEKAIDVAGWAAAVVAARERYFPDRPLRILTELGRIITAPHGVLVSRVINRCHKGREIVGLDASMSALMRPALYGAYHHISLPFVSGRPESPFDVVGGLCENMDKFALDRTLPDPRPGDIALIHDTGAHGHAMGFTYNGRLRPAELLLTEAGEIVEIRRAENFDDYTATVCWQPAPVLTAGMAR